jgi:hypothetical protein
VLVILQKHNYINNTNLKYLWYTGHTQKNGAVSNMNSSETAPFFCVCPVLNHSRHSDLLWNGQSGFRTLGNGARNCLLFTQALGPTQPPVQWVPGQSRG